MEDRKANGRWFWAVIGLLVIIIAAAYGYSCGAGRYLGTGERPEPVYAHYQATELFDDMLGDPVKAKVGHKGEYVEIEGHVRSIDSGGSYFSIGAPGDDGRYTYSQITCVVKSEEQKRIAAELKTDDIITVRGRITIASEILGYSLDVESIEKT